MINEGANIYINVPNASGVYCIRNKRNNRRYIGFAKDMRRRCQMHSSLLRREKHNKLFQEDYIENFEDFETIVLELTTDQKREEHWIHYYQTDMDGYNIEIGHKKSKFLKEWIRQNNGMKGKKHSEETKRKMSETKRNNKMKKEVKNIGQCSD